MMYCIIRFPGSNPGVVTIFNLLIMNLEKTTLTVLKLILAVGFLTALFFTLGLMLLIPGFIIYFITLLF